MRQAEVLEVDRMHDLVLLRFQGAAAPAAAVRDSDGVREGQSIAFMGFPIGGVLGFSPVTHRGMISSIMELSRNLGLKITAEGIETPKQAALLQQLNCNYLQGYLCGRPAPAKDLAAIIMKRFAEQLKLQSDETIENQATG